MPEEPTGNVENGTATLGDPLREAQDAFEAEELETVLSQVNGGSGAQEAEETAEETVKDTSSSTSKAEGGIAAILNSLPTDQAGELRKILATNTQTQQELAALKSNMSETVRTAIESAVREARGQTQEVEQDDDEFTPEQIEKLRAAARKAGIPLQEDLDQRDVVRTRQQFLDEAKKQAVEEFGDSFGMVAEDGTVILDEDAKAKASAVWQEISDHGTVNHRQLHILANYEDLVKAAEERGYEKGMASKVDRVEQLSRARTDSTSNGFTPAIEIRGERGTPEDSTEQIVRRSLANALAKLKR